MIKKPDNILVVLPYWDGDKDRMRELSLLLADLLPERTSFGLLFYYRNDSSPMSDNLVRILGDKFANVTQAKCHRVGIGFPMGPNEMYFGLFDTVSRDKGMQAGYGAMLVIESDCVLTRRAWDKEVSALWEKAKEEDKLVSGALIPHGYAGFKDHINAAALYAIDIRDRIPELIGCSGDLGWDWVLGRQLVPVARPTDEFFLDYKKPTIDAEQLFTPRTMAGNFPLMYHGVKDDSAIRILRETYKLDVNPAAMSVPEFAKANGMTHRFTAAGEWVLTPANAKTFPPNES